MFHMRYDSQRFHWTKIYVTVTVSAMFIEDVRQVSRSYLKLLVENKDQISYSISM